MRSVNGDAVGTFAPAAATVVVAVLELFAGLGSAEVELTVAVFVIVVPFGVAAFTFTTIVNAPFAPEARLTFVQVIVPAAPTTGVVQA